MWFHFPADHAYYPYKTNPSQYWPIPVFAPILGALAGVSAYKFFIESHWPNEPEVTPLLESRPASRAMRYKKPVRERSVTSIFSLSD